MQECLIAFGSNAGNRLETYLTGIEKLNETEGIQVTATSRPLNSVAIGGPGTQAMYLNGAIRVETSLDPCQLHRRLIEIENELGRIRSTRWGSRTIDLDLLLYAREQINTKDLTVPHPRMSFRRFVLEPACEIAGHMIHPPSAITLNQLVSRLNEAENLVLCVGHDLLKELVQSIGSEVKNGLVPHWSLRLAKNLDEFREFESQAKLVTYVQSLSTEGEPREELHRLRWAARHFSGPTLELPPDLPLAKLEILAAMDAMNPLQ